MTPNEYQRMALRTECDKEPFIKKITDKKNQGARLTHVAIGIMGDLVELSRSSYPVNVKEELGDILWYLAVGYSTIGETISGVNSYHNATWDNGIKNITNGLGSFSTAIERVYFYQTKELDQLGVDTSCSIKLGLGLMIAGICQICKLFGWTIEEVMEANIRKLAKRYPKCFHRKYAAEENRDREGEAQAVCSSTPSGEPEENTEIVNDLYAAVESKREQQDNAEAQE